MDFYETQIGQRFYGHTLPQIADALQTIAGALSAPPPCIRVTPEVPKDFLTELYWGNYDPSNRPDSEESVQCAAEIKAAQEAVKSQLTPEVWAQVDNIFSLIALIARRNDMDRAKAYAAGFQAAVTMLAAGLSGPDSKGAA